MAIYIDEFLYRGRAPDDNTPPGWHLTVRDSVTKLSTQFNMAAAVNAGYALPTIISAINIAAVLERDAEIAKNQALTLQVEVLLSENASLKLAVNPVV